MNNAYMNPLEKAIRDAGFRNLQDFLEQAAEGSPVDAEEMEVLVDSAFQALEDEFNNILSELNY